MEVFDFIVWGIGNLIAIGIAYGIAYHFKYKVKTQQEIIWERNRESLIWYSLSTMDNDVIFMNAAFTYLEWQNLDFSEETVYIETGNTNLINHLSIQGQIDRLPTFSNALGFMTHKQYDAITEYLGYSLSFMKSLEEGIYQKFLLELRAEKAKEVLELFPDQEKIHDGLKQWKEQLQMNF